MVAQENRIPIANAARMPPAVPVRFTLYPFFPVSFLSAFYHEKLEGVKASFILMP
jgi:hypothetical protein